MRQVAFYISRRQRQRRVQGARCKKQSMSLDTCTHDCLQIRCCDTPTYLCCHRCPRCLPLRLPILLLPLLLLLPLILLPLPRLPDAPRCCSFSLPPGCTPPCHRQPRLTIPNHTATLSPVACHSVSRPPLPPSVQAKHSVRCGLQEQDHGRAAGRRRRANAHVRPPDEDRRPRPRRAGSAARGAARRAHTVGRLMRSGVRSARAPVQSSGEARRPHEAPPRGGRFVS
jgi:hypothetical protein